MTELEQVFELVCRKLSEAQIRFLMIGGHAVNYYGFSRATLDIDFMVASDKTGQLREIMMKAGFSNISEQENVVFFNRPGSKLRIDFLRVDSDTMEHLIGNAVAVEYGGVELSVPALSDLIAMKLFSLKNGGVRRKEKDFQDVVYLVNEHGMDLNTLKQLCLKFADEAMFDELKAHVENMGNA